MSNAVISQTCPVGDCRIVVTWEFAQAEAKKPGFLAASKKRLHASLEGNHEAGVHDKVMKQHRAKKEAVNV